VTDRAALLAALEDAASALSEVAVSAGDAGDRTWSRGGIEFAVLTDTSTALRIGATIAAAALRTPDVTPSPRGSDWVSFAPQELDGHALDRLGAWFGAAHRRAVGSESNGPGEAGAVVRGGG